jgi:hypothetical protein
VLWLHPADVVPKPLLRSLSRRIERTVFATDAYQALAEVCSLAQEGLRTGKQRPIVLLMMKPLRLADADQTLHYLDMYAPRTRRWRFDPSAQPIFGPMSEQDVARLSTAGAGEQQRQSSDPGDSVAGLMPRDPGSSRMGDIVVPPPRTSAAATGAPRRGTPSTTGASPIFPSLGGSGGAGGVKSRPSPKPRLRLVEADPSAETIVGTPGPGGTNFSQLTPEELQMLLADPPTDGNGGTGGNRGKRP